MVATTVALAPQIPVIYAAAGAQALNMLGPRGMSVLSSLNGGASCPRVSRATGPLAKKLENPRIPSSGLSQSISSLKNALSTGKGSWAKFGQKIREATGRSYSGGTNIEEGFINVKTGETLFRHTIVRGSELLYSKFRDVSKEGL